MMMDSLQCSIMIIALILQMFSMVSLSGNADHKIIKLPGQPQVSFKQYAGYINVDNKQSRALFYYFVQAESDSASKPLVLWLNGGPGCSSIGIGAFAEHGPFRARRNILVRNNYSWNKVANMLYLESPAGVGFSYSANKSFYDNVNDEMTARDNFVFLQRWFSEFPEFKENEFFITGESYAGHYVPQLAQLIDQSRVDINLKGIALGNPLLEFDTIANSRAEYLWSHGILSDSTYQLLTSVCNYSQIIRQSQSGALTPACYKVEKQASKEVSDFVDLYDVTLDVCLSSIQRGHQTLNKEQVFDKLDVCVDEETNKYLNRKDVQDALHAHLVGVNNWTQCTNILNYSGQDLDVDTLQVLGELAMSGLRILVFSGDQDAVVPLTGTRPLLSRMAKELGMETTVPYRVWFERRQVAGWTQVYNATVTFATIRGASHKAPFSQPGRSLVLFIAFLDGKPLPQVF